MKHAALLVAALALSPVAMAQDFDRCDFYNKVIAAAPTGFEPYQGTPIPDRPGIFTSTLNIPGNQCLATDGQENGFYCYTMLRNDGVAQIGYMVEMSAIRRCFPDWDTRPPASTMVEGDPIIDESIQFFKEIDNAEISIGVLRAHVDAPEPAPRIVGIGVIWRPLPTGV
jgi:hypothetical protein